MSRQTVLSGVTNSALKVSLALTDRADAVPLDLSDAQTSAVLRIKRIGAEGAATEVACTKLTGRLHLGAVDTSPPYDTAGRGGRLQAVVPAATFDQAGDYLAEVRVTPAVGQPYTSDDTVRISVRQEL